MNDRYLSLVPSPAEKRLIAAAANGEEADLRPNPPGPDGPSSGAAWGEDRTVRADVIYALCLGLRSGWRVHAKGVRLRGARIAGCLDFEYGCLIRPLRLLSCYIPEAINLEGAIAPMVDLGGSLVAGIKGDGLISRGAVSFDEGFVALGRVTLLDAEIGGQLICSGGHFCEAKAGAIEADGITVKGDVFLDSGFTADGEVSLVGAEISGQLCCRGGRLSRTNVEAANPAESISEALDATGAEVGGDVFLDEGFTADGEVSLLGARIDGQLSCRGGRLCNPGGVAIDLERGDGGQSCVPGLPRSQRCG